MSISDAITEMIKARQNFEDAQEMAFTSKFKDSLKDRACQCEKAVDDAIAMLIQNELGDILAKIKELTK